MLMTVYFICGVFTCLIMCVYTVCLTVCVWLEHVVEFVRADCYEVFRVSECSSISCVYGIELIQGHTQFALPFHTPLRTRVCSYLYRDSAIKTLTKTTCVCVLETLHTSLISVEIGCVCSC